MTTAPVAGATVFRHVLRHQNGQRLVWVRTEIEHLGATPLVLEMLSSFTLGGVSPFEGGRRPEALAVHRIRSTWSNEGRLVCDRAEDLQLEPSWSHPGVRVERFGQVGSLPVRKFFPFVAVVSQRLLDLYEANGTDQPTNPIPFVFNEFCSTWGQPWEERIRRPLGALEGRGLDFFVFPRGLAPSVNAIREAGLGTGLWFERETCGPALGPTRIRRTCFFATGSRLPRDSVCWPARISRGRFVGKFLASSSRAAPPGAPARSLHGCPHGPLLVLRRPRVPRDPRVGGQPAPGGSSPSNSDLGRPSPRGRLPAAGVFPGGIGPILCHGTTYLYGPPQLSYRDLRGWQAIVRVGAANQEVLVVVHSFGGPLPPTIEVSLPWNGALVDAFHLHETSLSVEGRTLHVAGLQPFDAVGVRLGPTDRGAATP